MKKLGLFLLLIFFILIFSINLSESTIFEYEADSLKKGEQFYFQICSFGEEFNLSFSCIHEEEIHSEIWSESCRIYGVDSENLICDTPIIRIKDSKGIDEKEIKLVDYESSIKGNVYKPYEKALNIAIKIYASSLIQEDAMIYSLVEKLKLSRSDTDKCWPSSRCNVYESAHIAYFLSKAGLDRTNRVYHDLLLWLESQQNKEEYEDWEMIIRSYEDVECTVKKDATTLYSVDFEDEKIVYLTFDYEADTRINVSCDDSFTVEIRNKFGELIKRESQDFEENFTFMMQANCWAAYGNREYCSPRITSLILLLNELNEDILEKGKSWIEEELMYSRVAGKRFETTEDVLANVYAYELLEDEDIRTWVLFNQKNKGYFESEEDYFATIEVIRVMRDIPRIENWILDARNWIFEKRPKDGWDDLLLDSISMEVFDSRELIRIDPIILYSEGKDLTFELKNNNSELVYELVGEVKKVADVSINGSSGKLRIINKTDGIYPGHIIVSSGNYLKKFPAIVYNKPIVDLIIEKEYYVQETKGVIPIRAVKSDSNLDCSFIFNKIFYNFSEKITEDGFIGLEYFYEEEGTNDITLFLECTSDYEKISKTYDFKLSRFEKNLFSCEITEEIYSGEYGFLKVFNEIGNTINISLRFKNPSIYYSIPKTIEIDKKHFAEIYLFQKIENNLNITEENVIIVESLGYSQEIPVIFYLGEEAIELEKEYVIKRTFRITKLIRDLLPFGFIFFMLFFIYKKRKRFVKLLTFPKKKGISKNIKTEEGTSEKEDSLEKEDTIKSKSKPTHNKKKEFAELISLFDAYLGKDREEIAKELLNEGYSRKEIDDILKEVDKFSVSKKEDEVRD